VKERAGLGKQKKKKFLLCPGGRGVDAYRK
jgi:hypothetical protein